MKNDGISIKVKLELLDCFVEQQNYEDALKLCDDIIAEDSSVYVAYRERSHIFHLLGRESEAFRDLLALIDLRPSSPSAYLRRAEWNLELGRDQAATEDLTFVINSGDKYFLDTAFFYRSIAYLNQNNKNKALEDCLKLPDDFSFYVKTHKQCGRHLSRDDILRDINAINP